MFVFLQLGKLFPFVFLSENITDLQLAVDILGCKLLIDLAGLLLSDWRTQDTFATMLSLNTLGLSYFIEGFTCGS